MVVADTAAFLAAAKTPQTPDPTGGEALATLQVATKAARQAGV